VAARIFVGLAATVALLLLGAALGLLITVPSRPDEPSPTPVDVGFAQDMSVHHQQAVTMATLARENATDLAVRQLAFDIDTNQRDQIGRMHGWLSLWDQPAQSSGPPMQWMQSPGHGHQGMPMTHRPMPGMVTSQELAQLQSLRGPAFDVLFLQLMLRHHEGGAPMAGYGTEHAGTPAARALAANILSAQSKESDLMRRMLSERGAAPLPPR
jgi:uncharacterized protein (DUF305 family)